MKHTTKFEKDAFINSFLNAVPLRDYFAKALQLQTLCRKGTVLSDYFLFHIGSEYYVLNLNNGFMVSWFEKLGDKAWVNRPNCDTKELTAFFTKVLSQFDYVINDEQ